MADSQSLATATTTLRYFQKLADCVLLNHPLKKRHLILTNRRDSRSLALLPNARLGSSTWLLHLRWMAVAGQLVTILVAMLFTTIELHYPPLLVLVAFTAVTNLLYTVWHSHAQHARSKPLAGDAQPLPNTQPHGDLDTSLGSTPRRPVLSEEPSLFLNVALALILIDLVTLTLMLYFSGGADNPFSFFYFVNLAVAGVMIRRKPAWTTTVFAIAGYTFLLLYSQHVEGISIRDRQDGFDLRSAGLLLAFSTCAIVVTYFVTRTAGELQNRERLLRRAEAAQAASYRLEGLTTLAAGAAHELATPLSTIDVISRELSHHLEGCEKPASVDEDLRLIDKQLEWCRQILARMRSAAGDAIAHRWDHSTVGDLIDATLEGVRDPHRVDVDDGSERVENQALWLPREAVAQAIRNLVHNGLDASGTDGRVYLKAILVDEFVELIVQDSGEGMSNEVRQRAGDPFFTTKEPGRGIGLGLFLTRNVISQLGGELSFRSAVDRGTVATVRLPIADTEIAENNDSQIGH